MNDAENQRPVTASSHGVATDLPSDYDPDVISSDALNADIGLGFDSCQPMPQTSVQRVSPIKMSKVARADTFMDLENGLGFSFAPLNMAVQRPQLKTTTIKSRKQDGKASIEMNPRSEIPQNFPDIGPETNKEPERCTTPTAPGSSIRSDQQDVGVSDSSRAAKNPEQNQHPGSRNISTNKQRDSVLTCENRSTIDAEQNVSRGPETEAESESNGEPCPEIRPDTATPAVDKEQLPPPAPKPRRIIQYIPNNSPRLSSDGRIQKPSAKPPNVVPMSVQHVPGGSSNPSEEDLLLLLMRRNRQRENVHFRAASRQSELENENIYLREQNSNFQKQQRSLSQDLAHFKNENESLLQHLQQFKGKYQKLKTWAIEFNAEYSILREHTDNLSTDLDAVKTDRESLKSTIEELKSSVAESDRAVGQTKEKITQTSLHFTSITQKLQHSNELLLREQSARRDEQAQNKRHAHYITRLESAQNGSNKEMLQQQHEISESLQRISSCIQKADIVNLPELFQSCQTLIESINGKELIDSPGIKEILVNIHTFGKELYNLKMSLSEVYGRSNIECPNYVKDFDDLKTKIDELQPNIDTFQKLQVKAGTLEERSKAAERQCHILQREKMSAQLCTNGLLQVQRSLVDCRVVTRDSESAKTIAGLQANNDELHSKCEIASMKLKKAVEKLQTTEARHKQICSRMEHAQSDAESALSACTTSLELQIEKERREAEAQKQQLTETFQVQIRAKDDSLASLRSQLENMDQINQKAVADMQELSSGNIELKGHLERMQTEHSHVSNTAEDYKQQLATVHTQIGELQNKADKIPILEAQIREKAAQAKVMSLQQNLVLEERLAEIRGEKEKAMEELQSAQARLRKADEDSSTLQDIQNRLNESQSLVERLKSDLLKLQEDAGKVPDLERTCLQKDSAISELKDLLDQAQLESTELTELRKQHEQLGQNLSGMSKALAEARKNEEAHAKAQKAAQEKNKKIKDLERHVQELKAVTTELAVVKEESQQKDVELASLHDRVMKLEEQSQQFESIREHLPEEMIDKFFSQDVCLSWEAAICHSQKQKKDKTQQTTEEDTNTPEDLDRPRRIVDRSVPPERTSLLSSLVDDSTLVALYNEGTNLVPDSQMEIADSCDAPTRTSSVKTSSLSELCSLFEEEESDDPVGVLPNKPPHSFRKSNKLEQGGVKAKESSAISSTRMKSTRPPTSHDEMLLQSSEPNQQESPVRKSLADRVRFERPSAVALKSPTRLRSGSQVQIATPFPGGSQASGEMTNVTSPGSHSGVQHRPNSAAKRQSAHLIENHQFIPKKLKRTNATGEANDVRTSKSSQRPSGAIEDESVYDLPSGSRSGRVVGSTKVPARKMKAKRVSKSDMYSRQFGIK